MIVYPSGIFEDRVYRIDPKLCFVIMPFSQKWSKRVYKLVKEIVESTGNQCVRADDDTGRLVLRDIWQRINEAAFVIADLTKNNPNVYYELGIAHTLGKEVISILQHGNDIPFDQRAFRILLYEDNLDGYQVLKTELPKLIDGLSYASTPQMLIKTASISRFNSWRQNNPRVRFVGEDFSGLALTSIDLSHAQLSESGFEQTFLDDANMTDSILIRTRMKHASLKRAILIGANLSEADLEGSDFAEADLSGAILLRTRLTNVNLSRANVKGLTIDENTYNRHRHVFQTAKNRSKMVIE